MLAGENWSYDKAWNDGANRCCGKMSSEVVSCSARANPYFGGLVPRSEMIGTREFEFVGSHTRVPAGLEAYLTRLYGQSYMTPPPPEKREKHVVFAPLKLA